MILENWKKNLTEIYHWSLEPFQKRDCNFTILELSSRAWTQSWTCLLSESSLPQYIFLLFNALLVHFSEGLRVKVALWYWVAILTKSQREVKENVSSWQHHWVALEVIITYPETSAMCVTPARLLSISTVILDIIPQVYQIILERGL